MAGADGEDSPFAESAGKGGKRRMPAHKEAAEHRLYLRIWQEQNVIALCHLSSFIETGRFHDRQRLFQMSL